MHFGLNIYLAFLCLEKASGWCIIDFLVGKRDLFCCVWMHRNAFS